eukprot:5924906-Prymnesium_polylepis.1
MGDLNYRVDLVGVGKTAGISEDEHLARGARRPSDPRSGGGRGAAGCGRRGTAGGVRGGVERCNGGAVRRTERVRWACCARSQAAGGEAGLGSADGRGPAQGIAAAGRRVCRLFGGLLRVCAHIQSEAPAGHGPQGSEDTQARRTPRAARMHMRLRATRGSACGGGRAH